MTETVTIGFLINGMYALCDSKHHTRPLTHYSLTHSLTHSLPLSLTDIITTCLLYMCCLTVTSCLNYHDWDSHDVGYYRLSNVTQNILPTHSLPHYSLIHPLTYLLTHPLTHLITCTHPLTHCLSPTHSLTASSHIHRYRYMFYCTIVSRKRPALNQVMITSMVLWLSCAQLENLLLLLCHTMTMFFY